MVRSLFGRFLTVLLFCLSILTCPAPVPKRIKSPAVPSVCPPELRGLRSGVSLTELVVDPAVVTPTGIDVDARGRIWTVASHTHFRPDDYVGPEHDEVLVFSDRDGDGRYETREVFYAATDATMDLELGPDGWVYLAERDRILRVKDTDGDGRADREESLAVLQSEADYPHNGHAGLAWHPDGDLVFALGENFWKEWVLTGTDGRTVRGTGEGGIFRCRADGTGLRRIAKGFWNPFGVCVRSDGEIFAAENDPGSRPPCRLLHIVEGGDYGYQRLYGRAPFHPFVGWNGELRGTLPMVAPTGEAPCGVAPLGGGLLVPSWADHRIDFFPLRREGATYRSERVEIAAGGDFFRPVCIKQVSPSTYYLTDWVFGSYELHGRGRVWKLEIDLAVAEWLRPARPPAPNDAGRLAEGLRTGRERVAAGRLFFLASGRDPFLAAAAIEALSREVSDWPPGRVSAMPAADRVTAVLALRRAKPGDRDWAARLLEDESEDVVFEALRWIADERMKPLSEPVGALLRRPGLGYRLFEAALAAWNTLTGDPRAGIADTKMLVERVRDAGTPAKVRAYALRLLPPDDARLNAPLFEKLLKPGDSVLNLEVIRSLAARAHDPHPGLLAGIAADERRPVAERVEAVPGLARDVDRHRDLLLKLVAHQDPVLRGEALRALRFAELDLKERAILSGVAARHADTRAIAEAVLDPGAMSAGRPAMDQHDQWHRHLVGLQDGGDPEAGRRIFFHPRVALCASCHRHSGRGVVLGPDLSAVAERDDRDWLADAILRPNRDVAPQFYPWSIETKAGEEFVGIMLRKGGTSGREFYRDSAGNERSFVKTEIVRREELKSSMMPEGLMASLTDGEIRDLMAFLRGR
jgi:putative membrane-bound dehydrogenase-like protein